MTEGILNNLKSSETSLVFIRDDGEDKEKGIELNIVTTESDYISFENLKSEIKSYLTEKNFFEFKVITK